MLHSKGASGQSFGHEVTRVLESLYQKGMNGWGQNHETELRCAMAGTGLSLDQVKVCAPVTQLYHKHRFRPIQVWHHLILTYHGG